MSEPPTKVPGEFTEDAPTLQTFSLENILGEHHDKIEHPGVELSNGGSTATGWDQEIIEDPVVEGFCVECEGKSRCL